MATYVASKSGNGVPRLPTSTTQQHDVTVQSEIRKKRQNNRIFVPSLERETSGLTDATTDYAVPRVTNMRTIDGKVVVLGSQGVGKTSLIGRYVEKRFNHHANPTIGACFFNCKLNLEAAKIKLQVWDTAGQERFRSMAPMYYRNANAAMLVFDLTQYNTFSAIKGWVTELQRNVEEAMVLTVIGNKSDLLKERQVNDEEGRNYATKIGATYHEISVLHNEGVEAVFLAIADGLLRLTSTNHDAAGSLRIYDSVSSCPSSGDMPLLSPSVEETSQNTSIAHGISEKPYTCC